MVNDNNPHLRKGLFYEDLVVRKMNWQPATEEQNFVQQFDAISDSGFHIDIKSGSFISEKHYLPIEVYTYKYKNGVYDGMYTGSYTNPNVSHIAYYDIPTKTLYMIPTEEIRKNDKLGMPVYKNTDRYTDDFGNKIKRYSTLLKVPCITFGNDYWCPSISHYPIPLEVSDEENTYNQQN